MTEQQSNVRALKREWLAARVMVGLALVLLLALAVAVTMGWWQVPGTGASAPGSSAAEAEARHQEGVAICTTALAVVQNLGLVPQFATLDGGDTKSTDVQGRYVCAAKTDTTKYAVTFDLTCTNLGATSCIAPYSVILQDGTVIYKRS
jgi:hypothetical protein